MNTVKFDNMGCTHTTYVTVNGEKVARLESGGGMVYVYFRNAEGVEVPVARFKYMKPKMKAKKWTKFMLERLSSAEVVNRLKPIPGKVINITPLGLAQELGFDSQA